MHMINFPCGSRCCNDQGYGDGSYDSSEHGRCDSEHSSALEKGREYPCTILSHRSSNKLQQNERKLKLINSIQRTSRERYQFNAYRFRFTAPIHNIYTQCIYIQYAAYIFNAYKNILRVSN